LDNPLGSDPAIALSYSATASDLTVGPGLKGGSPVASRIQLPLAAQLPHHRFQIGFDSENRWMAPLKRLFRQR
jgi:hypothetical protein